MISPSPIPFYVAIHPFYITRYNIIIYMTKTIEEHLEEIDSELASLILKISDIANTISGEFPYWRGKADTKNVFGELQVVADKWADEFIIDELRKSELIKTVVSEEQPDLVKLNDAGMFNTSLDLLNGSSNIESNNLVGPEGRLRLLVESNTMSFIAKEAGEDSTNGKSTIREVEPEGITQRVPTYYIGNKDLIEKLEKIL